MYTIKVLEENMSEYSRAHGSLEGFCKQTPTFLSKLGVSSSEDTELEAYPGTWGSFPKHVSLR